MIVNVGEILNRHDTCSLKIVIFKLSSSPDSDLIIAKGNDLIWSNYVTLYKKDHLNIIIGQEVRNN